MLRIISSGRGGFYVEAATDLGAAWHEVPTVQHHDPDLLYISESSSAGYLASVIDCR